MQPGASDSRSVADPHDVQDLSPGEQRIKRWDDRARPWIILAALVPIIATVVDRREGILLAIDFVAWGIFVVDLVVHVRNRKGFLKSGVGIFDLSIVVLTFPWYIIPGFENADIILLARLARVARLFMAGSHTRALRSLFKRLGRAFLYATILLFVCSLAVQEVEHGQNGFKDFGDSLWWGVVTITTVGYGDLVPETTGGRIIAVVLMLGGLALLGTLAGSLSAFLRIEDTDDDANADVPGAPLEQSVAHHVEQDVARELAALRAEIAELTRRVAEIHDATAPSDPSS